MIYLPEMETDVYLLQPNLASSAGWLVPLPGQPLRTLSPVVDVSEPMNPANVTDRWRYLKEPAPPAPSHGPGR